MFHRTDFGGFLVCCYKAIQQLNGVEKNSVAISLMLNHNLTGLRLQKSKIYRAILCKPNFMLPTSTYLSSGLAISKPLIVWSLKHWGKWLHWKLNNRQLPPRWTLNALVLRPHFVTHKIIVKVHNCSTSGSTCIRIYKITRIFTYKAIPRFDINHIFLPKIPFFLAVIVKTEYGISVIFTQGRQDTMSRHYLANITNYRPGRNNFDLWRRPTLSRALCNRLQ